MPYNSNEWRDAVIDYVEVSHDDSDLVRLVRELRAGQALTQARYEREALIKEDILIRYEALLKARVGTGFSQKDLAVRPPADLKVHSYRDRDDEAKAWLERHTIVRGDSFYSSSARYLPREVVCETCHDYVGKWKMPRAFDRTTWTAGESVIDGLAGEEAIYCEKDSKLNAANIAIRDGVAAYQEANPGVLSYNPFRSEQIVKAAAA